jgi:hypothetical protein
VIGLVLRAALLALMRGAADMVTWALLGVVLPLLGAWMAILTLGFYIWLRP